MAVKYPTTKLQGLFKDLMEKLKVIEFKGKHFDPDTLGGLKKNIHYKAGKGAPGKPMYDYLTDSNGRLKGVYADLQLKPQGQKRGKHNSKSLGKLSMDDAGHMIADRFDGSG